MILRRLAHRGRRAAVGAIAALTILACATTPAPAPPALEITLEHDSDAERAIAVQLRRLVAEYDVDRWIETRRIHVDERAIPHSHPVLTVHTRHRGDDHGLLATFLHEQFHWLEAGNPAFRAAMDEFARIWPEAPARGPEGARDRESTYRHLLVNDLEYQAMTMLVGEARARAVLGANRHYTWIYDRVLNDPRVREVARRHGFSLER
jgi:hypothetical protein